MLFYRAALPLSRSTLNFVAGVIRRHRASIRSLWRRLSDPERLPQQPGILFTPTESRRASKNRRVSRSCSRRRHGRRRLGIHP